MSAIIVAVMICKDINRVPFKIGVFLLLMAFSGCYAKPTALTKSWPVAYYPTQFRTPVQRGYIIFRNNDTLKGFIKLTRIDHGLPTIPIGKKWEPASVINVKYADIVSMRLYADSAVESSQFSDYVKTDDQHLWRLVARKEDVAIYDNYINMAAGWQNKTVLVTPGSTIKLFSWIAFMAHFENARPLLEKFIYKRYKVRVNKRDFNSDKDIISYILDKEYENVHLGRAHN